MFKIPVSGTLAYRQFGNTIVVPVAEAVARHLEPWVTGGPAMARSNVG